MSLMLHNKLLTKENIDEIFTCFALNCLKDNNHPSKIEIYMVGGGAIMLNFDYRLSTIDFDAFFIKDEVVNAAIKETAKEKHLPSDWLNQDFVNTPSFSSKIVQVSKLYKVYHNIVYLYSLEPVYLIAMKLKSSRPTGGDLDDIIKMIFELRLNKVDITYEQIIDAYKHLYNDFSHTYSYFFEKTKKAFEADEEEMAATLKKHHF